MGGMPKKKRDNNPTQVTATVRHYHPFARSEIPTCTGTYVYTQMDNSGNADTNCFLCAFSVERESKEWYREEFQISKAIFHFPPSEGI